MEQDGPNDRACELDRAGVFRSSVRTTRADHLRLSGPRPARPDEGGVIAGGRDLAALDRLLPHPVSGWMGCSCAPNPSEERLASALPVIEAGHEEARAAALARLARPLEHSQGRRPRWPSRKMGLVNDLERVA